MKRFTIAFVASLLLFSCAKQEPPKQAETPKAPEPLPAAEVTAVKGGVRAFCGGSWQTPAVGQKLLDADSLDIPASAECEFVDTTGQTVKIAQAQKDAVSVLMAQGKQAHAAHPAAKALSSVKKMASKPQFQVTTPTAVAGVRGAKGRQQFPDTARKDSLSH